MELLVWLMFALVLKDILELTPPLINAAETVDTNVLAVNKAID